jgi:aryl-alcohol dehydrogenase-like predicted oxidoreductase
MNYYAFLENKYHNLGKTIQNPYSLLNRLFENASSEICARENVGLLAYSMGFGYVVCVSLKGEKSS